MNTHQILDLGRGKGIYADRFDGFEWLVHRHAHLLLETPNINAVRYDEWIKLVEYMEQRIREYVPEAVFDRKK